MIRLTEQPESNLSLYFVNGNNIVPIADSPFFKIKEGQTLSGQELWQYLNNRNEIQEEDASELTFQEELCLLKSLD